jgi:hypothetical protein
VIYLSNKGTNKGFNPGYDYSDLVKYSKRGNPELKRIFQKWKRRELNKQIDEQLEEMEEVEE